MIKNLLRVLSALALSVLPLASPATAAPNPAADPGSTASKDAAPPAGADVPLIHALAWVGDAPEGSRTGYSREQFKYWSKGLNITDGCDTRKEIILAEAVRAPAIGPKCALTGGRWRSEYDQVWITSASSLDVDHMVPLAEAWDSGAATWAAARRET